MKEIKWLTVKEASLLCFEMGLPRSTKSIRRWCRFENIEAQKRHVANTQKWFIDRNSLEIKVKEELEFLQHSDRQAPMQVNVEGQSSDTTGHDRTGAVISGLEQTRLDASGHERPQADTSSYRAGHSADVSTEAYIHELEHEIQSLKIDVAVNDRLKDQFKDEYLKGANTLHAQARYIGHLENDLLRLGGEPNEKFLTAPTPKEQGDSSDQVIEPEIINETRPHPNQQTFYSG